MCICDCYCNPILVPYYCSSSVHKIFTVRVMNGYAGANARRRISIDKQGPTVVHQKPGPLQTIFDLPLDEVSHIISVLVLMFISCSF